MRPAIGPYPRPGDRWISVRDGVPAATPFPASTRIDSVLAGPGDVIYAVTAAREPTAGSWDNRLVALDPADLSTVLAEHDVVYDKPSTELRLQGAQIVVTGVAANDEPFPLVEQGPTPHPVITSRLDVSREFDVTFNGHTITWELPAEHDVANVQGLADGSVALLMGGPVEATGESSRLIVVVRPDGTSVATDFTGISESLNYTWTTDRDAVIQLEHNGTSWQVVRYRLPT